MNEATDWDSFIAQASGDRMPPNTCYERLVLKGRMFFAAPCLITGRRSGHEVAQAQGASVVKVVLVSGRVANS
jgi:hypothetical protein